MQRVQRVHAGSACRLPLVVLVVFGASHSLSCGKEQTSHIVGLLRAGGATHPYSRRPRLPSRLCARPASAPTPSRSVQDTIHTGGRVSKAGTHRHWPTTARTFATAAASMVVSVRLRNKRSPSTHTSVTLHKRCHVTHWHPTSGTQQQAPPPRTYQQWPCTPGAIPRCTAAKTPSPTA